MFVLCLHRSMSARSHRWIASRRRNWPCHSRVCLEVEHLRWWGKERETHGYSSAWFCSRCSCLAPQYMLKDASGNDILSIVGPKCICDGPFSCCCENKFTVCQLLRWKWKRSLSLLDHILVVRHWQFDSRWRDPQEISRLLARVDYQCGRVFNRM